MYVLGSLGCPEVGLEPLISCMGGERSNEEAKWQQPLVSVTSASLRSGEGGLLAQHLLAGLRYTHPLKPHSHLGHGTIVTGSLGCSEVGLELLISCMGGRHSNEEAKWKRHKKISIFLQS